MKKKIVITAFLLLILITVIFFILSAINEYNYEMANKDIDIMEGLGTGIVLVIGGFAVFYELDLFHTVFHFFAKSKNKAKSVLNVLANISLFLIFFTDRVAQFLFRYVSKIFGEEVIVLAVFVFIYLILKILSVTVPDKKTAQENC